MAKWLSRLGMAAAQRAWIVITAWVILVGGAAGAMLAFQGTLTSAMTIEGIPAQRVIDELKTSFPAASQGTGTVVFRTTDGTAFTAAQKDAVSAALARVVDVTDVARVIDPFATEATIADKRAQVVDGKTKLAAGQAKLDAAQAQLDAAPAKLAAGEATLATSQQQLDAGKAKLAAAAAQIAAQQQQIDSGTVQLAASRSDLEGKLAQLDGAIAQAKAGGAPQTTVDGLLAQRAQLTGGLQQVAAKEQELKAGQAKLDAGAATIAKQRAALAAGQAKLDAGRAELEAQRSGLTAAQARIDAGLAEIRTNAEQLALGERLLAVSANFGTVSKDGTTALGTVQFTKPIMEIEATTLKDVINTIAAAHINGVAVDYSKDLSPKLDGILGAGEVLGLGVAALVLFVMLGTLIGAGLPVITALIGVGVSASITMALSSVIDMTTTTPVLGVMLGLAVGIDYTLFILNRHRRQLRAGVELRESIGLANGTSGSAVLFAGFTVVIALVALNLTGIGFLGLMGTVGAAAVVAAVCVALTLTPALLAIVGERVLSKKERAAFAAESDHSAAAQPKHALEPVWANRHPWLAITAGTIVVLTLAIPALSMRLGLPDGSSESADSTQYRAYTITSKAFGAGANGTILSTVTFPAALTQDAQLRDQADIAERIMALHNVSAVVPAAVSADNRTLMFQVIPTSGPASAETQQLVQDVRALGAGISETYKAELGVTGIAAMNIDISKKLSDVLPLYLGTVIVLSLLLLVAVFRSIAVPLLASFGFLASILATFGAVVAVFQWGWLGSIFGVHDPGPVLSFLPTILIGVLFGLAMDYQLFITSGMREAHVHGKTSRDSINYGVHLSRSVVVAAAAIMTFVFGGFAFSHMAIIRPMGFGLAFGVLVDAFIVRLLLVPAVMTILGDRAWWIPAWLDRVLPDVDIEGAALEREHLH